MRASSNQGDCKSQPPRQEMPAEIYSSAEEVVETVATLLAHFAVAISAIDRLSYIHRGITNAHNLLFASFLKRLSSTTGAEHTEGLQPVKDFKEAYAIQEEKFEAAADILSNPHTDKSESFLRVPQKEMLALDRSARAFLLKHGKAKKFLSLANTIGHTYSAGGSAALMNVARVGEYLGSFTREKLGRLKGLTNPAQLYFLNKILSDEVLKGPIGSAFKLDKAISEAVLEMIRAHVYGAGTILDAAQSLGKAVAPTLQSVKDAVMPTLNYATYTVLSAASSATGFVAEQSKKAASAMLGESVTSAITENVSAVLGNSGKGIVSDLIEDKGRSYIVKKVTNYIPVTGYLPSVGAIGGAVGSFVGAGVGGLLGGGMPGAIMGATVGKFVGEGCVAAVEAAKTYVLVPAVAGVFDGIVEHIDKGHPERVNQQGTSSLEASAATAQEQIHQSVLENLKREYDIAYETALEKFQKYDKPLVEQGMTEVLKMNPAKAKKVGALYGRQKMLTKAAVPVMGLTTRFKAGATAAASVIAADVYKGGKAVGEQVAERLISVGTSNPELEALISTNLEALETMSKASSAKAMADNIDKLSAFIASPISTQVTSSTPKTFIRRPATTLTSSSRSSRFARPGRNSPGGV